MESPHAGNTFLAMMDHLAYINQHWRDESRHFLLFGEDASKKDEMKRRFVNRFRSTMILIRFSFKCLAESDESLVRTLTQSGLAQKKIRTGRIFLASLKSFFLASCSFRFFLPLHAGFFVMFSFSGFSNDAGACHLSAETLQRII